MRFCKRVVVKELEECIKYGICEFFYVNFLDFFFLDFCV